MPRRTDVHGAGPILHHMEKDLTGKSADTDLIDDITPEYDGSDLVIKAVLDESSVLNVMEDDEAQGLNESSALSAGDAHRLVYGPVFKDRTYNFQLETLTGGNVSRLDVVEVVQEGR